MKFKLAPIIFSILALATSCTNDSHQISTTAEVNLPGRWRIVSISLSANPEGITYHGNTFYNDTILFDIGEFEFGSFNFHMSIWDEPESTPIACNLTLDTENFTFVINNLYISGPEMYGSFDQIIPGGIELIDTPGEVFVSTSQMFDRNYSFFMDGANHVRLEKFDWPATSVIEMEKIE